MRETADRFGGAQDSPAGDVGAWLGNVGRSPVTGSRSSNFAAALVHGSGFGILVWLPVLDWEP